MSIGSVSAAATYLCLVVAVAARGGLAQDSDQPARKAQADRGPVLATVNGQKITAADLARAFRVRQVPVEEQPALRREFLEGLIDAKLIERFLAQNNVVVPGAVLERHLAQLHELAAKGGGDGEAELNRHGYSHQTLKEELALRLAWARYVDQVYTPEKLRDYFLKNRAQFDGTTVRARHIFLKVNLRDEQAVKAGLERLNQLRQRVAEGAISFEEAAREYSDAPSKEQGGDVGWFPASGKMPPEFSRRAFALEPGQVSEAFQSPFGLHLCQLVERAAGDLSLEDAREAVLAQASRELWQATARKLRAQARIIILE